MHRRRSRFLKAGRVEWWGNAELPSSMCPPTLEGEDRLRTRIIALSREYGRYGYRRIAALLQQEGWRANYKRVERL